MQTLTREYRFFALAVVASAMAAIVLQADLITWHDWERILLFFGTIVIAFSLRVPDPRGWSVTPSIVLCYLAIYVFNLPTAILVVGSGWVVGFILSRGWVPWRVLFNGSQGALSAAIGSLAYSLLGGVPGDISNPPAYGAFLGGPLAFHMANYFFVGYGVSRVRGTPFLSTWLNAVSALFWPNLLSIPTAMLLAILYTRLHHSSILVYLILLPLQWSALRLYVRRRELYAQIVDGLVVATDVSFPLGRGHARRVANIAVGIAREMRLSEAMVESIQFASLLHDVGMIGKDDMLERSVVSAEDAEGLQDHVRVGAEIARELPRKEIANTILRHHERFDGSGYPGGLRGEAIPLGARILSVAEAVDSMVSGAFPYSSPIPASTVVSMIESEKRLAFDPDVVDAFIRTLERGAVCADATGTQAEESLQGPKLGESPAR